MVNKSKKDKELCVKGIYNIVIGFSQNMEAILQFFQILNPMVEDVKKQADVVNRLFVQKGTKIAEKRVLAKSNLTKDEIQIVEGLSTSLSKIGPSLPLLKKSSFLILMSYLEFLMKDVLKVYYYKHWVALQDKEIKISITDLNISDDIEELKQLVVEGYVDSIIYKNWKEQVKTICNLLSIKESELKVDLSLINEADKRRNILIHNEGKVNQKYNRESGANYTIGTELKITTQYFNSIYNEIYLLGLIFLTYISSNLRNDKALIWIICEDIFELLKNEKYSLILKYYESCKNIDFIDGELEIVAKVNYLLALKYSGAQEKFNRELNKVKTSHIKRQYQLAFAVLHGDKKKFYNLINKSTLSLEYWETWPLFKEFRKDKELSEKVYKKLISTLNRNKKKRGKNKK